MTPQTRSFILCVIIAILCVLLFWRGCGKDEPASNTEVRIDKLKITATKIKDSIIIKTIYQERIVTKWRDIRHDSLIPCETKLLVADTVIWADSSLIFAQKVLINVQGEIIAGQDTVITGLKKQVKKERNKKRLWMVLMGVAVVVNGVIR